LFHEVTRHLFIAIAMAGDSVKYAAGDLNEVDRFSIPPEIGRALLEFLALAREMAMGAGGGCGKGRPPESPGPKGAASRAPAARSDAS